MGWSSAVGGADASPWTTAVLNIASPPHAAAATLPATPAEIMLDSPLLSVPAGASRLRFTHQHGLENTSDGGVLEISIAGAPFEDILAAGGSFVAGGYTTTLTAFSGCAATPNPLGVRQAWSGVVPARETVVQLPAAALEQSIRLR